MCVKAHGRYSNEKFMRIRLQPMRLQRTMRREVCGDKRASLRRRLYDSAVLRKEKL